MSKHWSEMEALIHRREILPPAPARDSLFERDWWLDAASDGRWERAEAVWDGHVVCSLPYVRKRHWGLIYIEAPRYTRTLTPRFDLPGASDARLRKNQIKALGAALDTLPRHDRFELTLPPADPSLYSFVQRGYTATATYTYRTLPGEGATDALARMDQRTRHHVRKAAQRLTVERNPNLDCLIEMARRQLLHTRDHHDYPALERIWAACAERGQCCVLIARDDRGKPLAASALVWDDRYLYHWQTARDPAAATHEATALLIWKAIVLANDMGLVFDSDGYDSWDAARSISRFGFTPVVRPMINGSNLAWRMLHLARTAVRPERIDRHFRL